MSKNTVIVLHETTRQSVLRDIVTLVMIVTVIGTGRWLGSSAMQWLGFVMLCLGALTKAYGPKRMTPREAADLLHQRFGVCAGEKQP